MVRSFFALRERKRPAAKAASSVPAMPAPCRRRALPAEDGGRGGSLEKRRFSRAGKKKMRSLGSVQIPTEAFLAVLKLDE